MIPETLEATDTRLQPTPLCDIADEAIKKKTQQLTSGATTSREAAMHVFHFVRDGVAIPVLFPVPTR